MNKFNKGKTVGIVAASLAAVSLIGVGFSTWIINTTNTATTDSITVTVAETKDISVVISDAKVSTDDNSVKFDADATKHGKVTNPLLSCETGDAEDLSFTLTYKVTVGVDAAKWEIKAGIDDTSAGANGKFTTAVTTRKYIDLPNTLGLITGTNANGSQVCLNQSSTTGSNGLTFTVDNTTDKTKNIYTVTQKFDFSWGLAFANKNPVEVTANDAIYPQDGTDGTTTVAATLENLTANTKAMKSLGLSTFKVTLSVGNAELAAE